MRFIIRGAPESFFPMLRGEGTGRYLPLSWILCNDIWSMLANSSRRSDLFRPKNTIVVSRTLRRRRTTNSRADRSTTVSSCRSTAVEKWRINTATANGCDVKDWGKTNRYRRTGLVRGRSGHGPSTQVLARYARAVD